MKITICVADDHELVRHSLVSLLSREPDFEVLCEASDGRQILQEVQRFRPTVTIIDIAMPGLNGVEATHRIMELSPSTRVIILSNYTDEEYVLGALDAGAVGYIVKSGATHDLIRAIREGARGRVYLSAEVAAAAQKSRRPSNVTDNMKNRPLSAREREVLQLIAEGYSSNKIADILGVQESTIKSHRLNIMDKLNVHDTANLTRHAIKLGLIRIE